MKPMLVSLGERVRWSMTFILVMACVDRIDFNAAPAQLQTVVEGMITDGPGPYIVHVSMGLSLDADASVHTPVQNAKLKLFSDEGLTEDLKEVSPGEYTTGGIIKGQAGRTYYLRVETPDGKVFESEPELLRPVGAIEKIKFEYEAKQVKQPYGIFAADVFNIFVDADAGPGEDNYVRWLYKGTYKVVTNPELHMRRQQPYAPFKDPPACSGYNVMGGSPGSGGDLEKNGECTCCTCYPNYFETMPQLSDGQLVSGNKYKNVKVAEVPINNATFSYKYLVEVEQMSLTRKSFEFFNLVRAQKKGATNIFQPPLGEIKGNISAMNSNDPVIGIFWATSITKESIFIYPSDIPYPLPPLPIIAESCLSYYPNSTNKKPDLWP